MLILLPILIVLFVTLVATAGVALRSRPKGVARECLPVAQRWEPLVPEVEAEAEEEPAPEEGPDPPDPLEEPVFALTQNSQGTDLTLNDLMMYKLKLHYGGNHSLNDYLAMFRRDHP